MTPDAGALLKLHLYAHKSVAGKPVQVVKDILALPELHHRSATAPCMNQMSKNRYNLEP